MASKFTHDEFRGACLSVSEAPGQDTRKRAACSKDAGAPRERGSDSAFPSPLGSAVVDRTGPRAWRVGARLAWFLRARDPQAGSQRNRACVGGAPIEY